MAPGGTDSDGNYIYEKFHDLRKKAKSEAAKAKKAAAAEEVPVVAAPKGIDFRAALVSFYTERQPDKVGNVDKLLASYKGREEKLVSQMSSKYGLSPEQFYEIYASHDGI